ncbi:hypothetical protein FQA47_017729 [Oryzias melastigma]|uniref:Uncharacterized protein n=1 Tax=Oryzias melastigma TaxID=30732 RepID=A0A834CB49_ORYME|nr:hypothetical protein FQA47_017729 [Oryzias melastigma]
MCTSSWRDSGPEEVQMVLIHCWFWTTALEAVVPETILTVVQQGGQDRSRSRANPSRTRGQVGSAERARTSGLPPAASRAFIVKGQRSVHGVPCSRVRVCASPFTFSCADLLLEVQKNRRREVPTGPQHHLDFVIGLLSAALQSSPWFRGLWTVR